MVEVGAACPAAEIEICAITIVRSDGQQEQR